MNIEEYFGINNDNDLVTICVSGADSSKFLQGQLSNDIEKLSEDNYQYSTFSTNQGKVIATMRIFKKNSCYIILTNSAVAESIIEGLRKYVLMSKVDIKLEPSTCYGVLGDNVIDAKSINFGENAYNMTNINDTYILDLGIMDYPSYLLVSFTEVVPDFLSVDIINDLNIGKLIDLKNVFPRLNEVSQESFIPQVLNMEKHNAISYKKGCYTGQEIVARTHYLGKIKKKLFCCSCESAPNLNKTKIYNQDAEVVGELLAENYLNLEKFYFLSIIKINDINDLMFIDDREIRIEESQ